MIIYKCYMNHNYYNTNFIKHCRLYYCITIIINIINFIPTKHSPRKYTNLSSWSNKKEYIPNQGLHILFSIFGLALSAYQYLSTYKYKVNIAFDPIEHIIDIMYMYN